MGNEMNCCATKEEGNTTEIVNLNEPKTSDETKGGPGKARSGFNAYKSEDQDYENNTIDKDANFKTVQEDIEAENQDNTDYGKTVRSNQEGVLVKPQNTYYERREIQEKELAFHDFTKEYGISKLGESNSEYLERFPIENTIIDYGTLDPGKSFYWGERNQYNEKHGFGTLIMYNGYKYVGFWINNEFNLYGRTISPDLALREGQFSSGEINGQGFESTSNYFYEGSFHYGSKEGKGRITIDQEDYTGNFENNTRHGQGTVLFLKNNNRYTGRFTEGKITGYGKFEWSNGDSYVGNMENSLLQGEGIYTWANGDVYQGNFERNNRTGYGKLTTVKGKDYQGMFENNVPHGKGILIKKGKQYEVEYVNGVQAQSTQN